MTKQKIVLDMEDVKTQLNDITSESRALRNTDLSYLLQQDCKNVVITGDSLSYNRYDFDSVARANAYECYPGMLSWSFMLRDAIHTNDQFFKYGDEIRFRNLKSNTVIGYSTDSPYRLPLSGRYVKFDIYDTTEELVFTYGHLTNNNKAILYLPSIPTSFGCSFDIYVDGTFVKTVNNNGEGKKYQGYEPLYIDVAMSAIGTHEIKLTNFIQTASTPDAGGKRTVYLCGIGSKLTNVYLTGCGGKTATWLDDNLQSKVLDYNPNVVVIIIGANDRAYSDLSTFDAKLSSIITRIRNLNKYTEIVLVSPTSAADTTDPNLNNGTYIPDSITNQFIDVMKANAYKYNCYFLDLVKLFKNIPVSEWRYDNVHMKRYGNTILARTLLSIIMPNGLYDKKMINALNSYNGGVFLKIPEQVHGWAYIYYDSATTSYKISQENSSDIISVDKVNDYKIRLNFKYSAIYNSNGLRPFIYGINTLQYGGVSVILNVRPYAYGINYVELIITKTDGSLTTATDYTNYASSFKFMIGY